MRIETVSIIGLGALGILFGNPPADKCRPETCHLATGANRRYTGKGSSVTANPAIFTMSLGGEGAPAT
jgi:hypothetical protein